MGSGSTRDKYAARAHAFLHQKARARAAYLSLVEPDPIYQSFYCAIEVSVLKNNEGRLAAQLERQFLVALRRGFANSAPDFRRAGEGDLVHIGVLHQGFAG